MKNYFRHKGYIGSIEVSTKDNCLYGKIIGINDLISYETKTVEELKNNFLESLEDYLETCKQIGKIPEKSFSGGLSVRTGTLRHKDLAILATKNNMKLNELVNKAFDYLIKNEDQVLHQNSN